MDENEQKKLKSIIKGKIVEQKISNILLQKGMEVYTPVVDLGIDPRLVDSLKGVFTLSTDVKKQIENTRKDMETILRTLQ